MQFVRNIFFIFFILVSPLSFSYETDQYSTQLKELPDIVTKLDRIVNSGLRHTVDNWGKLKNEEKLIKKIFKLFSSRELERWLSLHTEIQNAGTLGTSIYRHVKLLNSPAVFFKGIAPTVNVSGIHLGADKLSHFFGVGRLYHHVSEVENRNESLEVKIKKAIEHGFESEEWLWGELTTNVFSNADLVANYEGLLFYYSLFKDDVIKGKKAIIKWEGNRPVLQRKFTFKDHITELWNEALFPSAYQTSLSFQVRTNLQVMCDSPDVRRKLNKFEILNEDELLEKYHLISFKHSPHFKLTEICKRWDRMHERNKTQVRMRKKMLDRFLGNKYKDELVPMNRRRRTVDEITYSWMPGCSSQINNGLKLYNKTVKWDKNYFRPLINKVEKSLKEKLEFIQSFDISFLEELLDEEYIEEFSELRKEYEIDLSTIKTSLDGRQLGESVLELLRYSSERARVCVITKVPLRKKKPRVVSRRPYAYSNIYSKTKVKLSACYQLDSRKKEIISNNFNYKLKNEYRTRIGLKNYYDLNDRNGFIYRTVSDYCKWY